MCTQFYVTHSVDETFYLTRVLRLNRSWAHFVWGNVRVFILGASLKVYISFFFFFLHDVSTKCECDNEVRVCLVTLL